MNEKWMKKYKRKKEKLTNKKDIKTKRILELKYCQHIRNNEREKEKQKEK